MAEVAAPPAMEQAAMEQAAPAQPPLPQCAWPQALAPQAPEAAALMEQYGLLQMPLTQPEVSQTPAVEQAAAQLPAAPCGLSAFTLSLGQATGLPPELLQAAAIATELAPPAQQLPPAQPAAAAPVPPVQFPILQGLTQPGLMFPQYTTLALPAEQAAMYVQPPMDLTALGTAQQPGTFNGIVKSFNPQKGFGFIQSTGIEGDIFFMKTDVQAAAQVTLEGRPVTFEFKTGLDGRSRATCVRVLPLGGEATVGVIKSFSERNGYGFISVPALTRDVHFKHCDIPPAYQGLDRAGLVGKSVSFQVQSLNDGKLKALQLEFVGGQDMPVVPRLAVSAPAPDQLRGFVKSYDAAHGTGTLQAPGVADDVQFSGTMGLPLAVNQEVSFSLQWMPDGTAQARNVTMGVAPLGDAATQLYNGAELTGTVKLFNAEKGYGFINVSSAQGTDLYFQRKDLIGDGLQMAQQGTLGGHAVSFWLEALPDGRWHARSVKPSRHVSPPARPPAASPLVDGTEMVGTIKSFHDKNGYGFISVPNQPVDIYFQPIDFSYETQQELQQQGSGCIDAGTAVRFWLQQLPGGRWRAREVGKLPPGDAGALQAVALTLANLTGPSPPPAAAQSGNFFDGMEQQGTVKSYNEMKGYGFINVPGEPTDLYFQTRDMSAETQQLLQMGAALVGATVRFQVQALPEGRSGKWRARTVRLEQAGSAQPGLGDKRPAPGLPGADGAPWADGADEGPSAAKQRKVDFANFAGFDPPFSLAAAAPLQAPAIDAMAQPSSGPVQRLSGTVKSYFVEKGYGFMTSAGLPSDIFFLRSELPGGVADSSVETGRELSFELGLAPDGKLRAKNIMLEG